MRVDRDTRPLIWGEPWGSGEPRQRRTRPGTALTLLLGPGSPGARRRLWQRVAGPGSGQWDDDSSDRGHEPATGLAVARAAAALSSEPRGRAGPS